MTMGLRMVDEEDGQPYSSMAVSPISSNPSTVRQTSAVTSGLGSYLEAI